MGQPRSDHGLSKVHFFFRVFLKAVNLNLQFTVTSQKLSSAVHFITNPSNNFEPQKFENSTFTPSFN